MKYNTFLFFKSIIFPPVSPNKKPIPSPRLDPTEATRATKMGLKYAPPTPTERKTGAGKKRAALDKRLRKKIPKIPRFLKSLMPNLKKKGRNIKIAVITNINMIPAFEVSNFLS